MDVNLENALNSILAKCGFVPNPTRTADAHNLVNPPNYERLDKLLKEFYGSRRESGRPKAKAGA